MHDESQHQMEVSSQLHDLVALTLRKWPTAPIE